MNGELILVNHPPEPTTPIFPEADAAGIAFSNDLIAVAFIGSNLKHVQLFGHKSETAFQRCPYWSNWKKNVVMFEDNFNVGRVLFDVSKKVKHVGFDPSEIKVSEVSANKFVPVDKGHWAESTLGWVEIESYLREVLEHAEKDPDSIASMISYYWQGLRLTDGHKTLTRSADRIEPIMAIINALAAEWIACDESMKASDIASAETEARERKAAEERECLRTEKRKARRTLLKQYANEHRGKVRVRNLRTGYILSLPYEGAFSLIELGGGEFAP
jgi:hypothetical protein